MTLPSCSSARRRKTLGFKRDLSMPEGALMTIVAFADIAGGALLVGVKNSPGPQDPKRRYFRSE